MYDDFDYGDRFDFMDRDYDDSLDGDFDSAMESAGLGTDEDYNHYNYYDDYDRDCDFNMHSEW